MSSASPFETDSIASRQVGAQSLRVLGLPAKFAGFWTAVLSPFVLLGLIASGTVQQSPLLLAGLLLANLVGLVLGRNYKR
jgi:hypothetical protein